jgi:hypothetical protein
VDLEELAAVDHGAHDVADVVRLVRVERDDRVELGGLAVGRVVGRAQGGVFGVVLGQVREQLPQLRDARAVVGAGQVADAAAGGVGGGPAEVFLGHLFVGDGLDDLGAGDEHVARALDHHDEVGDGRRVHGAARAGAHDGADLGHDAAGQGVAQEDLGVARQARDALLNARAARVVQADDGGADAHRQVHQFADFAGVGGRERAAEDGKVLGEDADLAPVDQAPARHHAVAEHLLLVHAEVGAVVGDEAAHFDERAGVEQEVDALAGRELTGGVLLRHPLGAAALLGPAVHLVEKLEGARGGLVRLAHDARG